MRWKRKDAEVEEKKYHDEFKGVQLLHVSPYCFRQELLRSCTQHFPLARPQRFHQSNYQPNPLKFIDKCNITPNKSLKLAVSSYSILSLVLLTQPPCLRYGPSTFTPIKRDVRFESHIMIQETRLNQASIFILLIVSSAKGAYFIHVKKYGI